MITLRSLYVLLPARLRNHLRRWPVLSGWRNRYRANTARHDSFYDDAYYSAEFGRRGTARSSAPHLAEDIVSSLSPNSVIDVGCGTGEYMFALLERGVEVFGVDLSSVAIELCQSSGLEVVKHDLTKPGQLPWTADVVFSCEVAEHLVPEAADIFVEKLCTASRHHVVLTAAGPRQPGNNHFNCQPKSYWIQKFEARNFKFDAVTTAKLEKRYATVGAAPWFQENLMIFRRIV